MSDIQLIGYKFAHLIGEFASGAAGSAEVTGNGTSWGGRPSSSGTSQLS